MEGRERMINSERQREEGRSKEERVYKDDVRGYMFPTNLAS